jgi:hypothetical protein
MEAFFRTDLQATPVEILLDTAQLATGADQQEPSGWGLGLFIHIGVHTSSAPIVMLREHPHVLDPDEDCIAL